MIKVEAGRHEAGNSGQVQEINDMPQKSIPKYAVNGPKKKRGIDTEDMPFH